MIPERRIYLDESKRLKMGTVQYFKDPSVAKGQRSYERDLTQNQTGTVISSKTCSYDKPSNRGDFSPLQQQVPVHQTIKLKTHTQLMVTFCKQSGKFEG